MCSAAIALGVAVGFGQTGVDHQAVAVLHQGVTHEAELGFLARALAVELGLRVGRRSVRLVRALLPVEIGLARCDRRQRAAVRPIRPSA